MAQDQLLVWMGEQFRAHAGKFMIGLALSGMTGAWAYIHDLKADVDALKTARLITEIKADDLSMRVERNEAVLDALRRNP